MNAADLEVYEAMLTVVRVKPSLMVNQSGNPSADNAILVPDAMIATFGHKDVQAALVPWRLQGWTVKRADGSLYDENEDGTEAEEASEWAPTTP